MPSGEYLAARTHCPFGHPYDEANTYRSKRGARHCRQCAKDRQVRYYKENPVHAREKSKQWRLAHPEALSESQRRQGLRGFGLTVKEYDQMLCEQNGVCAICHQQESAIGRNGTVKRLAVDHNPDTGKVRGLLCMRCNIGIGKNRQTIASLEEALAYLRYHDR